MIVGLAASMIDDPLVEEIRCYRQQHADQFGHDLKRIVEDLREKEEKSGRPRLDPGPKRITRGRPTYSLGPTDRTPLVGNEAFFDQHGIRAYLVMRLGRTD